MSKLKDVNLGQLVIAKDKGNYGRISRVDYDSQTFTVYFQTEDRQHEAYVEFSGSDLLYATTRKEVVMDSIAAANYKVYFDSLSNEEQDTITNDTDLNKHTSITPDELSKLGDFSNKKIERSMRHTWYPTFADFDALGDNANSSSKYNGDIREWTINHGKKDSVKYNNRLKCFEPEITGTLSNLSVGGSGKEDQQIEFVAGIIPLFGLTGSGKSELSCEISRRLDAEYIRFGEPEVPSIHEPAELMSEIENFINYSEKKILIVDSFRPFIYISNNKASTGSGGVNNALFKDFTSLSSIFTMAGKTLICIINPLNPKAEISASMLSSIESSTIGIIDSISYGQFRFKSRTESSKRINETFEIAIENDSNKDHNRQTKIDDSRLGDALSNNDDYTKAEKDWLSAIGRSFNSNQ